MSSTYRRNAAKWGPEYGIDGKISISSKNILHTDADTYNWVQLELVSPKMVSGIEVINRVDCCGNRLKDLEIRAGLDYVPGGTRHYHYCARWIWHIGPGLIINFKPSLNCSFGPLASCATLGLA